nr:wall-associated receptor kinase-like 1 [Ipomoea batatas]
MWGGKERWVAVAMLLMNFQAMLILAYTDVLILAYTDEAEADRYKQEGISMVPKGCPATCGNVNIYYPFGIGPNKDCYLGEWFHIICNKSSNGVEKPYLKVKDVGIREILGISFELETITIQEPISPFMCQSTTTGDNLSSIILNTNLSETPFSYPWGYNEFMLIGCGNAILTEHGKNFVGEQGGCTSLCSGKSTTKVLEQPCKGINCCQLSLEYFIYSWPIQSYQANFTKLDASGCNYAFIVAKNWSAIELDFPGNGQPEEVVVPVVWQWTIPHHNLPPSTPSDSCINGGTYWYNCRCPNPTKGNPFIANGCIYGVSASFGFLLLLSACFILYKVIMRRKMKKLREKFFKRNGGLLLQQQLLAKEGIIEKAKIFTANELDKATDHFNANRIVGQGGQGTVYKGMLIDEENRIMEILDREVSKQDKMKDVMAIVLLAQRCLNLNGKKRPTMKEVAMELDTIRASHPQLHSPRSGLKTLEVDSDFTV